MLFPLISCVIWGRKDLFARPYCDIYSYIAELNPAFCSKTIIITLFLLAAGVVPLPLTSNTIFWNKGPLKS